MPLEIKPPIVLWWQQIKNQKMNIMKHSIILLTLFLMSTFLGAQETKFRGEVLDITENQVTLQMKIKPTCKEGQTVQMDKILTMESGSQKKGNLTFEVKGETNDRGEVEVGTMSSAIGTISSVDQNTVTLSVTYWQAKKTVDGVETHMLKETDYVVLKLDETKDYQKEAEESKKQQEELLRLMQEDMKELNQ